MEQNTLPLESPHPPDNGAAWNVMDCLQYLPPNDTSFFQDDDSDVTVLSLPFSDPPLDKAVRAKLLGESDLLTFSDIHEEILRELKREASDSAIEPPPTSEEQPDSIYTNRPSRSNSEVEEHMRARFNDPRYRLTPPTSSDEEENEKKDLDTKKKDGREKEKPEEEEEYFDTMSGLWRMLGANDEFRISQPGFNTFEQATPHWSEKMPPSRDVLNKSRRKCEEWLRKNIPASK